MKTVTDIKNELLEIPITEVKGDEIEQKKLKKIFNKNNTRAKFLNLCIKYLEKKPSQEFIESEVIRLRHQLATINLGYAGWLMPAGCKNAKTQYELEAGVPHIKYQIKTMVYLLN